MLSEANDADPISYLLAHHQARPLPLRGVFYPLGFAVEILTNDQTVLQAAEETWGHLGPRHMGRVMQVRFLIQESPSKVLPPTPRSIKRPHLLGLIADEHNHALCDYEKGIAFATLTRSVVNSSLYFRYHFLEALPLVLLSSAHAPALHAACVSRHGQGFLLCGPSGAGKSTLAYACARAGFTYTSDDASYLLLDSLDGTDTARVAGHSYKARFRPHSRELFPELSACELTPRLVGKPSIEIPTNHLPGILTAQETQVHHLLLLLRDSDSPAQLTRISSEIVLAEMERSFFHTGDILRRHTQALYRLSGLTAFEFRYSALNEAINCLNEFVRRSTS